MALDAKLVFIRPADGNGRLVFGDDSEVSVPNAEISVDGDFDDDLDATIKLLWDANVSRGEQVRLRQHWQDGIPVAGVVSVRWQDSEPTPIRAGMAWQDGQRTGGRAQAHWQQSEPYAARAATRWQDATSQRHSAQARWQEAERRRALVAAAWQDGAALRHAVNAKYQEAIRLRRTVLARWQDATPVRHNVSHRNRDGVPIRITLETHWQDAMRPPAGESSIHPPVEPVEPPCFDPATLGRLEFVDPWVFGVGKLVFVCVRGGVDPEPGALVVIPVRGTYMVHNSVTLVRMPAGTEFEASSFTLDTDYESWTFGWSASLHSSARAHLLRSAPGERVEVQTLINGQALRLVIDSVGRDRSFPANRISVRGRGRSAELDEVALNFTNPADRTAQQLMADVLTVNGVPFGWTIDWQIQDWFVPAGAWIHQGSYISALQDIAGAAGAYLQPHLTDKVIRVLPRYAQAPWDWATLLTPDIELPVEATSLENTEEVIKPAYNRVFVGGVNMGVFGPVDRDGAAGDILAPQVTHALITAAEVHRQRGLAELSDTGLQEHLTLKTLVLPEAGIIMPGKVLRYVSEDGSRLGLVRKMNLSMTQWPVMHQTLGVETHVE